MNQSEHVLLNHLDRPIRFLGIHKDEALAVMVPVIGGASQGWILSGVALGIALLSGLRALKKSNEGTSLSHVFYWYLPVSKRSMKLYVPSHIREFIG